MADEGLDRNIDAVLKDMERDIAEDGGADEDLGEVERRNLEMLEEIDKYDEDIMRKRCNV